MRWFRKETVNRIPEHHFQSERHSSRRSAYAAWQIYKHRMIIIYRNTFGLKLIFKPQPKQPKQQFDPKQKIMEFGRDAAAFGRKAAKVPSLAYDALNNVVNGKTKVNVELTGYREMMKERNESIKNILLAVFACVIFIGSCILCMTDITPQTPDGMPVLSVAGFIFSIALGIYVVRRMSRKQ